MLWVAELGGVRARPWRQHPQHVPLTWDTGDGTGAAGLGWWLQTSSCSGLGE